MRPCQQCNAALVNSDKVCRACGAVQKLTVGLLKDPLPVCVNHPTRIDPQTLAEEERHWTLCFLGVVAGFHLLVVWLIWLATGNTVVAMCALALLFVVEAGILQGGLGG